MFKDGCGADETSQRSEIPRRDLSHPGLLIVSDEVRVHIATILRACGRDPSKAWAGWRSDDPFVVALLFAAHGFPVFPCSIFKEPLTRHGFHDATTNVRTLIGWEQFNRNRDFDRFEPVPVWAVRTGRYSDPNGPPGLWIWDVDDAAGYARWAELQKELGPAVLTWRCMSARPGGGEHWIYAPASFGPDMKTRPKVVIAGKQGKVDQKGRGGYAVIAGSNHTSGLHYHWAEGSAPDELPLAQPSPAWIEAMEKADEQSTPSPAPSRDRREPQRSQRLAHGRRGSLILGDGPDGGGFHGPINTIAIQYFRVLGPDASGEKIIAQLIKMIGMAEKAVDRDVSRYLSAEYLSSAVESARFFVRTNQNAY